MSGIKEKSGVVIWEEKNISAAPSGKGIFVLRSLPTKNGIIYIEYADDLKKSLREMWSGGAPSETAWFDWYKVDNEEEGQKIALTWIEKYLPAYSES